MKRAMKILQIVILITLFTVCSANGQSFFSRMTSHSGPKKDVPTVITSDAMDFDITKNVAVFTGNVQVDDANMRILCHKMIVRFEGETKDFNDIAAGKSKDAKTKNKNATGKKGDASSSGGTKVKDIECIKNVIIIRKLYDEKDQSMGEQKAIAGHAFYDIKSGKITLTINPSLIRGKDTLTGEVIIYWVDSERVNVRSGVHSSSELKIKAKSNSKKNK